MGCRHLQDYGHFTTCTCVERWGVAEKHVLPCRWCEAELKKDFSMKKTKKEDNNMKNGIKLKESPLVGDGFADAKMHLFISVCFSWRKKKRGWDNANARDALRLVESGLVVWDAMKRLVPTELGLELYANFRGYVMGEIERDKEGA